MVGLVLVSHSPALCAGVAELARAMVRPEFPLAVAAGTGDAEHPLGTNAELIHQAIQSVYAEDGVLVLMDLGSAVLSAEMALEFLPDDERAHVRLCAAPLVEGAVAAAVQADLGAALAEVETAALGALAPKAAQLGVPQAPAPEAAPPPPATGPTQSAVFDVRNRLGLHARPAAQFVRTAGRFAATITAGRDAPDAPQVNAKSINAVATLGIRQGERLRVCATGPDAQAALDALQALVAANFGESDEALPPPLAPAPTPARTAAGALAGSAASPGIAIGPAVPWRPAIPRVERQSAADPEAEWRRLEPALEATREAVRDLRARVARTAGDYQAAIFDAHLLFLDDAALLDEVHAALAAERVTAEYAWYAAIERAAERFAALDDPYQAARAADVRDVGRQVLARLGGLSAARVQAPVLAEPGILIATDLAPSDTAQLDRARVLAICTAGGGPTSHTAILARALGIPAVVGVGVELLQVPAGTLLIVDGTQGQVFPAPAEDVIASYRARAAAEREAQAAARAASAAPAETRDGRRVEVAANAATVAEARAALENGAEGIGLLRTEFVFLDRRTAPDEDEQASAYAAIVDVMGERPVIVRTLDVGGDKPLPYLPLPREENPFLGQRAIRLCLAQPEFFKTQLRAILRVSAGRQVRIMFPMIAQRDELDAARALLEEAREELAARAVPVAPRVDVGIMVEIPAAALLAARLAGAADFFSVGTNDLTQYTLAAERGNPQLVHLADGLHPAVLQEIRATVLAAEPAGRWVGVCGELAGDPLAIPVLVGLGVRELSMAPASIPGAKAAVRGLSYAAAAGLAAEALEKAGAAEVRRLVREWQERGRMST